MWERMKVRGIFEDNNNVPVPGFTLTLTSPIKGEVKCYYPLETF